MQETFDGFEVLRLLELATVSTLDPVKPDDFQLVARFLAAHIFAQMPGIRDAVPNLEALRAHYESRLNREEDPPR